MEYFKTITTATLAELIESTKKSLYLCMPSIHTELSDAILHLASLNNCDKKKIHLLLDFDAQTFRQGYGDFQSVEELIQNGIEVKCLKDNRISFIISDSVAYYLFVESRAMIPADKETINGVRIDPVSIVRLTQFFFPNSEKSNFKDELSNAIIEESKSLSAPGSLIPDKPAFVNDILDEEITGVRENLEKNPPLNPDFKRKITFYQNKFQYAELHYYGQRIEHVTVSIPSKLLPYKNEELKHKLMTRLKVFENINDNKAFQNFKTIEQRKNELVEKYLTPLKCRRNRSVLKIETKLQFLEEFEKLKNDLGKIKTTIYSAMMDELNSAKENLKKTMEAFLLENPTEEMVNMGEMNFHVMAETISTSLVAKISVDPAKMISKIKMDCHFADITFEDLGDSELINEFIARKLIDEADASQLANFSEGIQIKPSFTKERKSIY